MTPTLDAAGFTRAVGNRLDGTPLLLMLDIDGTLAPIAPTPGEAAVPDETRALLEQLGALRGVTLAFVSGRGAEDAARLAGVAGAWVMGNHGFELRRPDGTIEPAETARPYAAAVSEAARRLQSDVGTIPGVLVENKVWTLSLHYRLADAASVPRIAAAAEQTAAALGLRRLEGKMLIELRPPLQIDKGTACVAFAKKMRVGANSGSLFYAGDDRTDEDAFASLRAYDSRAVTVRVTAGDAGFETAAEFLLASTGELRQALELQLERQKPRRR